MEKEKKKEKKKSKVEESFEEYRDEYETLCWKNGIKLGEVIGKGGGGMVHEATLSDTFPNELYRGMPCAVKFVTYDKDTKDRVNKEISVQMLLDHPNIVRVYACFVNKSKIIVIKCVDIF